MDKYFIKSIKIQNFKCFDDFNADGFKRINLIGGKNNIGKTALMEACYLGQSTEDEKRFFHALIVLELSRNPLEEFKIIEDSNNFDFKFEDSDILINGEYRTINENPFDENLFDEMNGLYYKIKKNYNTGISEIMQFYTGKNKPLNIQNKEFISMNNIREDFISECIDEIKLEDNEDELNTILSELFDIKKIDVIKHQVMIKKEKEFRLLKEFGDGVKHFLNVVLALFLNKDNTIYLDEIDNGIHYSLFDKLWKIVFKISNDQDVQVFATTHSKECIESYNRVSKKLPNNDISYIKMTKQKDGKIKAIVRDSNLLDNSLEQEHEVRG